MVGIDRADDETDGRGDRWAVKATKHIVQEKLGVVPARIKAHGLEVKRLLALQVIK